MTRDDRPDPMGPLIDDLVAEQTALDAALAAVPEADWARPSPAEGWLLRDCIAHLAQGDEMARRVAETREPLSPTGRGTPSRDALHGRQVEARALSVPELVDWWRRERDRLGRALRTCAARDRLPWAGRRMSARSLATSRLAECW